MVLGAVYLMKVAASPLDPALPMGNRHTFYLTTLGAVYLTKVAVSPLGPALPMGNRVTSWSWGLFTS